MKNTAISSLLALAAFLGLQIASQAAPIATLRWEVAPGAPRPASFRLAHGASALLEAHFLDNRSPIALPEGFSASMYYRTNSMSGWWPAPHEIAVAQVGTNGIVRARWAAALDGGADEYQLFLRVSTPDGGDVDYSAFATLTMLESPGFVPNALPLPVQTIDFAAIEVTNAPWATPGYVDDAVAAATPADYPAVSNAAMHAVQAETDPTVPAWAKAAAAPAEEDPVFAAERAQFLTAHQSLAPATNYTDSAVETRLSRAEAEDGYTEWEFSGLRPGEVVISMAEDPVSPGRWMLLTSERAVENGQFSPTEWGSDGISATRVRLRPTAEMESEWDAKLELSDLSGYPTAGEATNIAAHAAALVLSGDTNHTATAEALRLVVGDLWRRVDALDGADGSGYVTAAELETIYAETAEAVAGRIYADISTNKESFAVAQAAIAQLGDLDARYARLAPTAVNAATITSTAGQSIPLSQERATRRYCASGTSALTIASFTGLSQMPCWLVLHGYSSVNWPSGAVLVSGGYESGKVNYFRICQVYEKTFIEKVSAQ